MDYVIRDAAKGFSYDGIDKIGLNTAKVGKYLEDNKTQLNILFKSALGEQEGAAHMERLQESYRALRMTDRARIGTGFSAADVSADPFQNAMGFSFRTFFNLARAGIAGRTSVPDIAVALGGQAATHHYIKAFNAIQQQILTDPDSSKNLVKMVEEAAKVTPDRAKMLSAWEKIAGNAGAAKEGAANLVVKSFKHYTKNLKTALPGAASTLNQPKTDMTPDDYKIDIPEGMLQ
jgi:hypothetical protein